MLILNPNLQVSGIDQYMLQVLNMFIINLLPDALIYILCNGARQNIMALSVCLIELFICTKKVTELLLFEH